MKEQELTSCGVNGRHLCAGLSTTERRQRQIFYKAASSCWPDTGGHNQNMLLFFAITVLTPELTGQLTCKLLYLISIKKTCIVACS